MISLRSTTTITAAAEKRPMSSSGEAVGVLAGDALLNYAYETAWKAFPLEEHTDRVVRAFGILCQKTGISGMLGGQSVDVMNEKSRPFRHRP